MSWGKAPRITIKAFEIRSGGRAEKAMDRSPILQAAAARYGLEGVFAGGRGAVRRARDQRQGGAARACHMGRNPAGLGRVPSHMACSAQGWKSRGARPRVGGRAPLSLPDLEHAGAHGAHRHRGHLGSGDRPARGQGAAAAGRLLALEQAPGDGPGHGAAGPGRHVPGVGEGVEGDWSAEATSAPQALASTAANCSRVSGSPTPKVAPS